jgi:hypothetical protein
MWALDPLSKDEVSGLGKQPIIGTRHRRWRHELAMDDIRGHAAHLAPNTCRKS